MSSKENLENLAKIFAVFAGGAALRYYYTPALAGYPESCSLMSDRAASCPPRTGMTKRKAPAIAVRNTYSQKFFFCTTLRRNRRCLRFLE